MKAYLWLNNMKKLLCFFFVFLLSLTLIFIVKIPIVKAESINIVYAWTPPTWNDKRNSLQGIHPASTAVYSATSQSFRVNQTCKIKSIAIVIDKYGSPTGYYQGRITTAIVSGSYVYPNESNILAFTPYYSSAALGTSPSWKNLTINQEVTFEMNTRYVFYVYIYNATINTSDYVRVWYDNPPPEDANENFGYYISSAWYTGSTDLDIIVYGDTEFDKLSALNENSDNNENGIVTNFSCFWYASGSVTCSGYIFSYGLSGSMQNDTWIQFPQTNNTWANISKILNFNFVDLGKQVYYQWFANSSSNKWYYSQLKNFTLQATVTFSFNEGGIIRRNNTVLSNNTQTIYTSQTNLEMIALCNSTYGFLSWNYTNSLNSNISNPFIFTVANKTLLSCVFCEIGEGVPFEFLGNATVTDVLQNQTFYSNSADLLTGNLTLPTPEPPDYTPPANLAEFVIVILIFGVGGLLILIVLLRRR